MDYVIHSYPSHELDSVVDSEVILYPVGVEGFPDIGYCYEYVPHTYLNGLVNGVRRLKVFLTLEYVSKEEVLQRIGGYDGHLGIIGACVFVIGELKDSYVFFMFNADVSDCLIERIGKKEYSYGEVLGHVMEMMQRRQLLYNPERMEYLELDLPDGELYY